MWAIDWLDSVWQGSILYFAFKGWRSGGLQALHVLYGSMHQYNSIGFYGSMHLYSPRPLNPFWFCILEMIWTNGGGLGMRLTMHKTIHPTNIPSVVEFVWEMQFEAMFCSNVGCFIGVIPTPSYSAEVGRIVFWALAAYSLPTQIVAIVMFIKVSSNLN